jgi:uncharacterized membrane protein
MIKVFTLIFLSLTLLASYLTYNDIAAQGVNVEEEKSVRSSSYSSGGFSGGGYSYGK